MMQESISTSSIDDGLDFACNLTVAGILLIAEKSSNKAPKILRYLAQYIEFRYVGEALLALEYLIDIGKMLDQKSFRAVQFWAQLRWVAGEMKLSPQDFEKLELPNI